MGGERSRAKVVAPKVFVVYLIIACSRRAFMVLYTYQRKRETDMKKEDILEKLKGIIQEIMKIDVSGITDSTRLKEDLKADSLDKINMLMALEEAYDIEMDEDEALAFKTVGDVVDYLTREL